MKISLPPVVALLFLSYGAPAEAQTTAKQLGDQHIAEILMHESRETYYRTGHPCACPEDLARNGSRCGKRSAYSRPGGATPFARRTGFPGELLV